MTSASSDRTARADHRIGSLADILAAKPRRLAEDETPTTREAPPEPRTPRPARRRRARPTTPERGTPATGRARVVCRVPADLHQRLVEHQRVTGRSQGGAVLAAIEDAEAAGAFESLLADRSASRPGALFAGTDPRPAATAKVTLDLRLRRDDLAVLDGLVVARGARDRTQFIVAALRHRLD